MLEQLTFMKNYLSNMSNKQTDIFNEYWEEMKQEINPMTKVKDDKMEHELMQHTCPYCHADFKKIPLIVVYDKKTEVEYSYDKDWIAIDEEEIDDRLFSIECSNCHNSLYSYFYDEFKV